MTVMSIPAVSNRIAVCLSTCGVTVLVVRLGQDIAAVVVCCLRRAATASRLIRVPVRVGNTNPLSVTWLFGGERLQGLHGLPVQGCGSVLAAVAVLCPALAYAEQRFGELEMPCQVRESGLGDVGQLGIILVADRGFLHAGPWVSGEGGDGDDESVRGGGEWPASAVQARF